MCIRDSRNPGGTISAEVFVRDGNFDSVWTAGDRSGPSEFQTDESATASVMVRQLDFTDGRPDTRRVSFWWFLPSYLCNRAFCKEGCTAFHPVCALVNPERWNGCTVHSAGAVLQGKPALCVDRKMCIRDSPEGCGL